MKDRVYFYVFIKQKKAKGSDHSVYVLLYMLDCVAQQVSTEVYVYRRRGRRRYAEMVVSG